MKKFIFQIVFFVLATGLSFLWILTQADGHTDASYLKFTSPKQTNLIIGTSRAAQGLQPQVFNEILETDKFYNYAFTLLQSPFGSVYYQSIQKKIDTTQHNGIFIITVDPWAISSDSKTPNDSTSFREAKLMLATTSDVNCSPNFEYLYNNLGGKYHKILFPINSKMYLHDDGWLELNLRTDSITINKRTKARIKHYRTKTLLQYHFSEFRLKYLIKTIEKCNKYGQVFIIRLPISEQMMDIENKLMPDFDTKIKEAIVLSKGYLDMTKENNSFTYTDGNHLYKKSGKIVSKKIALYIKNKLKR